MSISPDGMTVRFITEPEGLFEAEKTGAKPNTVRLLDAFEADLIRRNPPTKIIIQHQQEVFLRDLTHIHETAVLGKFIVVFSWTNAPHQHTPPVAELPLDVQAINISLPLREKLDIGRGNRTYSEFLEEILKSFLDNQAYERESKHD